MKVISAIIAASLLVEPVVGIIGGTVVKIDTKTYMTGLRQTNDPNSPDDYSFCGGALISPTHVVTSAVCLQQYHANFVGVGAHYLHGNPGDGDEIKVVKVTIHPKFDKQTSSYDVAILALERPTNIKPVKLPEEVQIIYNGTWIQTMGWGLTSDAKNALGSQELLKLRQEMVSNDDCAKKLNITLSDIHFCAGGMLNQSPCGGDSGSPGILDNNPANDSDDVLFGLVIGSKGCGVQGMPTVYTRLSTVVSWIKAQIKAPKQVNAPQQANAPQQVNAPQQANAPKQVNAPQQANAPKP